MMQNMNESARRALDRLRDPDSGALHELAALIVAQTTATPLRDLASPRFVAGQLAAALEAVTHGDGLQAWAHRQLDRGRERWRCDQTMLASSVPEDAHEPLRGVLGRRYVPDEELLHRLIDQPAMRALVHAVLTDTVTRFRRRVTDVEGMLGIHKPAAGSKARSWLGVAQNIVGAVREEVDHAFEGRIREFVDGATREAMLSIAAYLADEQHAEAFANMRLAVLDVVLETPLSQLAAEADKVGPEEVLHVVMLAIRSAVERDDFVQQLEDQVVAAMDEAGAGTFGEWLEQVELHDVWTETTRELVAERLAAAVGTDQFTAWWEQLHRD